ncbi:MAG: ATP-binding protein [Candidatus Riesia sp.]|nr:ATP-binding protein [Candidatus Riesia sp.]
MFVPVLKKLATYLIYGPTYDKFWPSTSKNNISQNKQNLKKVISNIPDEESMFDIKEILLFLYRQSDLDDLTREIIRRSREHIEQYIFPKIKVHGELAYALYFELRANYDIIFNTNEHRYVYQIVTVFQDKKRKKLMVPYEGTIGRSYIFWKHKESDNIICTTGQSDNAIIARFIYPRNLDKTQFITNIIHKYEDTKLNFQQNNSSSRFAIYTVCKNDRDSQVINVNSISSKYNEDEESNDGYIGDYTGSDILKTRSDVDESFLYDQTDLQSFQRSVDPFASLYYDAKDMHVFYRAKNWIESSDWFSRKNIRWQLGMLFHGVGGTGKTEMAIATAKSIGIPIYMFYLSTLTDAEFHEEWNNMETPCIALFEDLDNVFNKREPVNPKIKLTFDSLLNAISGVNARDGVMLIITTNRIEYIDEALGRPVNNEGLSSRPGRIDLVHEFGNMNYDCRYRMALNFFDNDSEVATKLATDNTEVTPAQFQEICTRYMYDLLADE